MGMFDSFYMNNIKCPYCKEITEEMEFQTKQFENTLNVWKQTEKFDSYSITINDGIIHNVYGGCCKPKCKEYVTKENGYWGGFGRRIFCDIKIQNGFVEESINIRSDEDD